MTNKNLGSATVSGGIARTSYTIPSDELVGDFTLNGTYVENNHYKEATATADFKVRIATTVTVGDVTANHGESATFTANVKYDNTLNVNEGQVQFKLGGTIIGTGNVSQGVATCSYTIPQSVEDGTEITANFLGTSTYGASVTTSSATLHVRGTLELALGVETAENDDSANRGETVVLYLAAFPPEGDTFISSGNVSFYIDNVKVGEDTTANSSGDYEGFFTYEYTIPSNMSTGSHTLKGVIAQSEDHESAEMTGTLVVRMPTHIVANPVSANAGSTVNIVANIYDENDSIVTEGQATFTDPNNQTSNVSVGSGGTATKSVTVPSNATEGSTIQYTVVYNQNTNYTSATSVTITITVRKTPVLIVSNVTANRGDIIYLSTSVTYGNDNVNEGTVTYTLEQT